MDQGLDCRAVMAWNELTESALTGAPGHVRNAGESSDDWFSVKVCTSRVGVLLPFVFAR